MRRKRTDGADLMTKVDEYAKTVEPKKCEREGCNEETRLFRFCLAHLDEETGLNRGAIR